MFTHIKDLQFNARVSKPDPRFARLLLEQFGGGNGELKAAMQYFVQAFGCRHPFPDKYDLLMDIATEEFSHLEIVGATIQMLLKGVNSELKDVSETSELTQMVGDKSFKEGFIHEALTNPHFFVVSGGGPTVTDSQGVQWSGAYVNANGDLTVDMRSNMAAESRAKIVYEYLMKYTDDPLVKETLRFLMTREVAHYQMFEAALDTIQPNFPPGILESDPRYSNIYFNLSEPQSARGPWNDGESTQLGENWQYVKEPITHLEETDGLLDQPIRGTQRTDKTVAVHNHQLGVQRRSEVDDSMKAQPMSWNLE
ncbi:MAG: manganese catalase family protein [Bacteroidetes bacterium]|nr:manganese catalase family protein [Bacteroidota bacterium]